MSLKKFLFNPQVFASPDGSRKGAFHPRSNPKLHGKRPNPQNWPLPVEDERSPENKCAMGKLLIGFNVGRVPTWRVEDIVKLIRAHLRRHRLPEDSSFISQTGVYTHKEENSKKKPETIQENGCQVAIVKFPYSSWDKLSDEDFIRYCKSLAEELCDELTQKEIIVTVIKGGVEIVTCGISGVVPLPEDLFA